MSDPASETACRSHVSLAAVLHAAPTLLDLLPAAAIKSLLFTSSAAREAVHRHVKVLRASPWEGYPSDLDIQLLAKGKWERLEVLELACTQLDAGSIEQLQTAKWPKLRYLNVAGNMLSAQAVKQLSRGHWPHLDVLNMGRTRHRVKPAVQFLSNTQWPALRSLQLPDVGLKVEALVKLAQLDWPKLQHLDLSQNSLKHDAILQLSTCRLPQVTSLDLSANVLDAAAITSLCTAKLPLLENLELRFCELSLQAVPELLKGHWPSLDSLNLARNKFWCPVPVVLGDPWPLETAPMTTPWHDLKKLNLSSTGLTSVSTAVLHSWSTLEELNLNGNELSDECALNIVNAGLPVLKKLSLQKGYHPLVYGFTYWCMTSMSMAQWSLLEFIDLSGNSIDMTALTKAQWPQLRCLHLARTGFGSYSACALLDGQWPQLQVLDLSDNNMSEDETDQSVCTLMHGQWPLTLFSVRGNELCSSTLKLLLCEGWPTLETAILPKIDYSSICVGHMALDPFKHRPTHLCELKWSCECVLQQLTKLIFYDDDVTLPESCLSPSYTASSV